MRVTMKDLTPEARMKRVALIGAVLACAACYSNNAAVKAKLNPKGDVDHPLYVGTSTNGEVVVAATHYDAVNGLAVTADEVGQRTKEGMTCIKEMPTGTHVPLWTCRFNKDVEAERAATRDWLDKPRNCIAHCGDVNAH
jgi:hypothetical protein